LGQGDESGRGQKKHGFAQAHLDEHSRVGGFAGGHLENAVPETDIQRACQRPAQYGIQHQGCGGNPGHQDD
jgi:hypothetical protein